MDKKLVRDYFIELLGTFLLVLAGVGVTCVNYVTLPAGQTAGTAPLTIHQPGLVGMALAQGLAWAVLIALTAPVTGGYLNPAITLSLWLFNRLSTVRMSWLLGAQLVGSFLAATCLNYTFQEEITRLARFGTPHVNILAYQGSQHGIVFQGGVWAGVVIEFVLTFALVFAMVGGKETAGAGPQGAWLGGAVLTAAVLAAYPLTGAALNPARWFGPVMWEAFSRRSGAPFDDAFVYIAGPIVGAAAAGWWCFKIYLPGRSMK